MAAGVVTNCGADVLGDGLEIFQQVFERLGLQIGVAVESLVQVGDVGAVVLVVVNLHSLGVNVGFECVKRVRKRWDGKCHGCFLQSEI